MNKYWMYIVVIGFSLLSSSVHAVTVQWENSYHIGTEAGKTRLLVAELSAPASETVIIPFRIGAEGNATFDVDYTMDTSPMTIEPGFTSAIRTITIYEDQISEPQEYVTIHMGSPTHATAAGTTEFHALIIDND